MRNWRARSLASVTIVGLGLFAGLTAGTVGARGAEEHATEAPQYAAGEPGDPTKPFRVVELAITEGSGNVVFSPNTIEVNKGEQIKFVITNNGAFDHEFILDSVGHNAKHKIAMEKDPEMEHDDANGMRFAASKSGEILWKFSKAGP